MAEAFMRSLDRKLDVRSAGTQPAMDVHPLAKAVMNEIDIPLDDHYPKSIEQFINQPFDYVITVCDHARETCPVFTGQVKHRLHFGFEDPAAFSGTTEEQLQEFRRIRDKIREVFQSFYTQLTGATG